MLALAVGSAQSHGKEGAPAADIIARYDRNKSGTLEYNELVTCILKESVLFDKHVRALGYTDQKLQDIAEDWAADIITRKDPPEPLPFDTASTYIRNYGAQYVVTPKGGGRIGWSSLKFQRLVTDPVGLDKWKAARPVVATYRYDRYKEVNGLSVFGGIQFYKLDVDLPRNARAPNHYIGVAASTDLDMDASKPANQSTVIFAAPVTWDWVMSSQILSGSTTALSLKYITDRKFGRDMYEAALALSISSTAIRAGYYTYLGSLRLYWVPSLSLTRGDVKDAAGNEDLMKREALGAHSLIAPRLTFSVEPSFWGYRVPVSGDYFHFVDLNRDWNKEYFEGAVRFDITPSKTASVVVSYRKGFKASTFEAVNELLVGIGYLQ